MLYVAFILVTLSELYEIQWFIIKHSISTVTEGEIKEISAPILVKGNERRQSKTTHNTIINVTSVQENSSSETPSWVKNVGRH